MLMWKKTMWEKIEETVDRAVSGIVYSIWGGVGFSTSYDAERKQMSLIVYDKSYKCENKKEVINKNFPVDLEVMNLEIMGEVRAKDTVISNIEAYLINNYS